LVEDTPVGRIEGISGPVVFAEVDPDMGLMMNEMVDVGDRRLIGEVTRLSGSRVTIQVYEDTEGLRRGEPIYGSGQLLYVKLGPGLIGSIYDGLQRPLTSIKELYGEFIPPGVKLAKLPEKKWLFHPRVKLDDTVGPGDVVGIVYEGEFFEHRVMVPPGISGQVIYLAEEEEYGVDDVIARVRGIRGYYPVTMSSFWPVKQPRPYFRKRTVSEPLVTGTRVLDTMLPVSKGGVVAVAGGFGTGKTVLLAQLLKTINVDVVVYVGCGERGNEIADLLKKIPGIKDRKRGLPLINRTVIIANTSNMPVAAREASVYTGAAVSEFYRDMGYEVALIVDSTTRWAEALRELSSRQGEIPGEAGYPPYLASRLGEFYGRAGKVHCLGGEREGSLTIIAAVSPTGGDFSEPVTQKTMQIARAFWALDPELAYRRHYPAVNVMQSFSYYIDTVEPFWVNQVGQNWMQVRNNALELYAEKLEVERIVRLVGTGALSAEEQILFKNAELLEELFLKQSAVDPVDNYNSAEKQFYILNLVLLLHEKDMEAIKEGVPLGALLDSSLRREIHEIKRMSDTDINRAYWRMRGRMNLFYLRLRRDFRSR
jgi:V/A-type H+/Na+-transporting ATPase subunit A